MTTVCVRCRKVADPAFSIQHDECKHWTHTDCDQKNDLDFDYCDACLGKINLNEPLLPEHEPTTTDGRDYVAQPLEQGVFARIRRSVPKIFNNNQSKESSNDPFYLLRFGPTQCPVDWMMREKGLGLQHMLSLGVTMDDFANNGYDWNQIKLYKDIGQQGKERRIMALQSLKTTPDHFRTFPSLLPLKETELTALDLKNYFGLEFQPDHVSLTDPHGKEKWYASDVVRMGLKMPDLFTLGLAYLEQYMDLEPSAEEEAMLEATLEQIQTLQKNSQELEAFYEQQQQQQQPPVVVQYVVQPQPVMVQPQPPRVVSPTLHQNRFIAQAHQTTKKVMSKGKKARGIHELVE